MDWLANFINGYCYLCKRVGNVICDRCFGKLIPYSENSESLYFYNEVASKILLQSKYPPYNFYLLSYLIKNSNFKFNSFSNSLLCPIPISPERLFERKFNQAELIAKSLSLKTGLPYANLLIRKRNSNPLFSLNRQERGKELLNIFELRWLAKKLVATNTSIILVDDIKTTGQTLSQARSTLINSGFLKVEIFTIFSA